MNYKQISNDLKENIIKNNYRCSTSIYNPIEWDKIIIDIITAILVKNNNRKVLIVNSDYTYKTNIKENLSKINPTFGDKITYISPKYSDVFVKNFYFIIAIDAGIETINLANKYNKFILYININPKINISEFKEIKTLLPYFTLNISTTDAIKDIVNSPVKEWRHETILAENEQKDYDKCTEFIKDSLKIFGDLYTMECCRIGDRNANLSAMDCCCKIAYSNGWANQLDKNSEYALQIDKYYNPNAINERANLLYNIIRNRKNILFNTNTKNDIILKLCKDNVDKKIIIVSKTGEYANNLAEYLEQNDIKVGMFHNEVPAAYLYDSDGNIITYKSGENKGKAKLFKSTAISNNYKDAFNANLINVLIIKECSETDLDILVDIIIFTSTLIFNIFDFKTRYQQIKYRNKETILHRIYTKNTIEEDILYKETPNRLVSIQNSISEKNISVSEETGEINLN